VPIKEVVKLYNDVCVPVGRPAATVINRKRQQAITKIWQSSEHVRSLDWWKAYFEAAMTIPYMAKGFSKADGTSWPGADLDYLLLEKTVTKVVEA
jgi:hypothetical protein